MIIKLKNIGTIITGNTPSKKNTKYYDSNDIYFIKPDTLDDSKITVLNSSNEFISNNARDKARIVGKNAILITCIGSIGKVGIVTEGEYAFNQQINAIIPNELVIPKYLAYCLLFNKDKLIDIANAPVVPIINKSQFGEFEIIINEDLSVQQKIVNELNIIQEIILKQRQELEKMDDLIKARFIEMFGNPLDGSAKYPIHQVGEIADTIDPQPSHRTPPIDESGIPYISIKDCDYKTGKIDFYSARKVSRKVLEEQSNRYTIHDGDFIIGKIGTIGNPVFIPPRVNYTLSANVVLIQPNKNLASPYFLKYSLESDFVDRQFVEAKNSTSQAAFGIQKVRTIKVMNPDLNIQRKFADFVQQVDKSKLAVQQSLEKTQQLFDSLMQEYFG